MTNFQKLVLITIFVATNPHNQIDGFLGAADGMLSHPECGKALQELQKEGLLDENNNLQPRGKAIAHKLCAIGVNYEESALKGTFGNAQAMFKGGWEGLKKHITEKTLYVGSSGCKTIEAMLAEGKEILKGAVLSNEEVV